MADMVRSRIAPTPSGFLHIGNAYNFLLTESIVRKANGSLRLRIDDLDSLRVRADFLQDIFDSLQWLGIHCEEGPGSVAAHQEQCSQRHRMEQYDALLHKLVTTGLVFACNCSRKTLQQESDDGQYPGTCIEKGIPLDAPDAAWRIQTPPEHSIIRFHDIIMGEVQISLWQEQRHFIIRRRDGLPAYHAASLADDTLYDINTIVRGADLLSSTAAQLYLAQLLGLSAFGNTAFYHHPLIMDGAGEKLSKSAGSTSLRAMRDAGVSPGQIRDSAAIWYQSIFF